MEANLPYDSLEKLVVQMFSMHFCVDESEIKVKIAFQILNHFLLTVIENFEGSYKDCGDHLGDCFPVPDSVEVLKISQYDGDVTKESGTLPADLVQRALEEGKTVQLHCKVPIGGDFGFRIIPNAERTHACIQHTDEAIGMGEILGIPLMIMLISDLNSSKWKEAQSALFPDHNMNNITMENLVRQHWEITGGYVYEPLSIQSSLWKSSITLTDIFTAYSRPRKSEALMRLLQDNVINGFWRRELGVKNPPLKETILTENLSDETDGKSSITEEVKTDVLLNSEPQDVENNNIPYGCSSSEEEWLTSNQFLPAISAAVGFVFTGAGLIDLQSCSNRTASTYLKKLAAETASGGVTTGIGAVSKVIGGVTAIGVGSIVAVSSLVLSSAYDSFKFTKGKMTKVEYRKSAASNIGGAAGGLIGGIGTTLIVTAAVSNPVGWALSLGAGAVAVVGGIAGSLGGKKIDKVIWDEGIDQIVHVYEFFGVKITRDTQPPPVLSPNALMGAYNRKVKEKHDPEGSGKKDLIWERKCQALFMLLLKFMFPVYADLLELTAVWKEKIESFPNYKKDVLYFFVELISDNC